MYLRPDQHPLGVELVIGDVQTLDLTDPTLFAVYIQNPDNNGAIKDYYCFYSRCP